MVAIRSTCATKRRCPPPHLAFDLVVEGCCLAKQSDAALEVLRLMQSSGVQPHVEIYEASSSSFKGSWRGQLLFSVQLLTLMQEAGIVPTGALLSTVVKAFAKTNDVDGALHFITQASELRQDLEVDTFGHVVRAMCRAGRWREGRELFQTVLARTKRPLPASCHSSLLRRWRRRGCSQMS
ncbi:unnamed protein product [Discosporangium mesarthrocarpum]